MSLASRKLIQATAGAAGEAAGASDDDFANVVLLLDGDGTSGDDNNTFTDSSTNGFTVTENGSVVQGSFSPYGDNWSVYANGYSTFVTTTDNVPLGSGDFTIEFWFFPTEADFGNAQYGWGGIHIDTRSSRLDGAGLTLGTTDTGKARWAIGNSVVLESSSTLTAFEWNHIAYVRDNGVFYTFINGVRDSLTYSNSTNFSRTNLRINGPVDYSNGYLEPVGNISNLRQSNTARYSGATYTVPTTSFTDDTNTKLLMFQANRFVDNSATAAEFTIAGTPKVTPFSPFKNNNARTLTTDGGSAYFEYGAANALSIPSDTNLDLSTGDFTVEMWVYLNSKISDSKLYMDWSSASNYWQFVLHLTYGWVLLHAAGTYIVSNGSASNVNVGEWQHLALTRSGNNFTIWQNGESFATGTSSANLGAWNAKNIGGWTAGSANSLDGYISDFRLTKGTALYSSSFTPPTSPISAGANTELFLKFQDAGIYDRSGINNLDTVGNAQIDTAVTKYGTGSIEFDGSGDYLEIENTPELDLSGSKWTVECWVYPTANYSTYRTIFTKRESGTGTTSYQGYLRTSTGVISYYNGSNIESSTALTSNQWSHCAWVYDGTNINIYVNGTSVLSTAVTMTEIDEPLVIGGARGYSEWFGGYLDDFRITKGIARYTADFTPPDAALPKF